MTLGPKSHAVRSSTILWQTSNLAIRHAKRTSAVVQTHAPRPLGAAEGVPVLGAAIGGWHTCGTLDLPQGGGWETPALVILAEIDHLQTSNFVRYSAVQRGTECGTARCSAVHCVTVRYSAIQCGTARYRVRYSAVQNAVQCGTAAPYH